MHAERSKYTIERSKVGELGKNVSGVTARLFSPPLSFLTTVRREISWSAMKRPTNKHCDKSGKEWRRRDTAWPWTQCLRHRAPRCWIACSLSTADRRYEKFEKRRNWTSICGINPCPRIDFAIYRTKREEFRNATLTADRLLHGYTEYDYDVTFVPIFPISPISGICI